MSIRIFFKIHIRQLIPIYLFEIKLKSLLLHICYHHSFMLTTLQFYIVRIYVKSNNHKLVTTGGHIRCNVTAQSYDTVNCKPICFVVRFPQPYFRSLTATLICIHCKQADFRFLKENSHIHHRFPHCQKEIFCLIRKGNNIPCLRKQFWL